MEQNDPPRLGRIYHRTLMERRKILLDADVGIDDAIAMLFLAGRPDAEFVAVGSVHGNIPSDLAAANALRLLELCGLDHVPVAVGARRPMAQPLATAEWVHGADGLGNIGHPAARRAPSGESAVEQMLRVTAEAPGEITIVAVGPLTNLGLALCLDPSLAERVRSVSVMGGAILHEGNASPTAEANIWHDPEAAQLVFDAGWPITMVGLDVTMATRLRPTQLSEIASMGSTRGNFAHKILQHYLDVYEKSFGTRECPLHDPLAAGIALDPSYIQEELVRDVGVNLFGPTRGATIVDRRPWYEPNGKPLTRVAMRVDSDRFVTDLLNALR